MGNFFSSPKRRKKFDDWEVFSSTSINDRTSTSMHVTHGFQIQHWLKEVLAVINNSGFLIDKDVTSYTAVLILLYISKYFERDGKVKSASSVDVPAGDQVDHPIRIHIDQQMKKEIQIEEPIRQEKAFAQYSAPPISLNAEEINFPFLNDEKTITHLKKSHTMFIMRGVSGSGKSTLVNIIQKIYPDTVVCSADFYFVKEDGSYQFQQDLLAYAHIDCQEKARNACYNQRQVVVIDNTNIRRWEMKVYLDMAREFCYVVIPVKPRTKWCEDPYELWKRNKHGVSQDVIERKIRSFDDIIPYYYGWFLNIADSAFLYKLGAFYLESCFNCFPNFSKRWFWDDKDVTLPMLQEYFRMDQKDSSFIYHCTAFYCGSRQNPIPGREEYHRLEKVQKSCGQVFTLQVTGFTISPRTLMARIKLNSSQLELLHKPEEKERDERIHSNSKIQNLSSENYPQKGRCVHVTIATANNISASQSNFDLLDVCDKEYFLSKMNRQVESYPVQRGIIKCLDEEYCVVYLDQPLFINCVFSGAY